MPFLTAIHPAGSALTEPAAEAAGSRPFERAAERRQRHRDGFGGPACRQVRHLLLQPLLRNLQLAGQLRVQVAPRVDLLDERRPGGHRPLRRRARPSRVRLARGEFGPFLCKDRAFLAQRSRRFADGRRPAAR